MRETSSFWVVLLLCFMITWLTGCGGEEESQGPSSSGIVYVFPRDGMLNVPTTTSAMITVKENILPPSVKE